MWMAGYNKTSAVIDAVLKLLVVSGSLATAAIAPNALIALDKPVAKFFNHMDKREQKRELQRILYYMRQQQLISGNYAHGIKISERGKKRIKTRADELIEVKRPQQWDRRWRLVLYDIPESHKIGRKVLQHKLKELGFYQLQRSVLVHPYPCREVIATLTGAHNVNQYVSYIETGHIDQEKLLIKKFHRILHN